MIESFSSAWSLLGANSSLALLVVKATALLLAAAAVTLGMRRASAGTRHLIWLVTLVSLFLVPVLSTWTPVRLAILPPTTAVVEQSFAIAQPPAADDAAQTPTSEIAAPVQASAESPIVGRGPSLSMLQMLLFVWLAVALVIFASLARAGFQVARIVRGATPLAGKDWLDPLYEVSDRLNLETPPRLVMSEQAKMPFACGLVDPTVVLPPEAERWSPERRRAVMLHELAHIRRRDLVGHVLGRLACAVYWFHPLVWAAAKRLRSESERACDDIALASGARAADYAEHLLDIVTSVRRDRTPSVAMAMAQRKEFEGRMLAILDPEIQRTLPKRRKVATLVGMFALLSITVGAAIPEPRAAAPHTASIHGGQETPATMFQTPTTRDSGEMEGIDPGTDRNTNENTNRITNKNKSMNINTNANTDEEYGDAATAVARGAMPAFGAALSKIDISDARSPDERASLLVRVLRNDTSATLRRIAAWGLNEHIESDVAVPALADALRRDSSAAVREMAAWSLAEAEGQAMAMNALVLALRNDADPKVRVTAAWALGHSGNESVVDALTLALRDANADVRTRAVWGIGRIEPRQAPTALVAMLRDSDRDVRLLTAWALHRIEDPSTISALTAAMRAETDAELRYAYVRSLASLGEASVDAIRDLLDSPDARLKSIAVRAIAGGNAAWPWPWPEPRPFP